jgi:hypothetical protein
LLHAAARLRLLAVSALKTVAAFAIGGHRQNTPAQSHAAVEISVIRPICTLTIFIKKRPAVQQGVSCF